MASRKPKIDIARSLERPSHWKEIHDANTGRLLRCRPAGAPAGTWPHTPWWHTVWHDPYERINFWSHAVPAIFLLWIALYYMLKKVPSGAVMVVFALCSCTTHAFSALTHVYPDSHAIEKCDHVGITATIIGTPVSALMAKEHGHLPQPLMFISLLLMVAAFLRPRPRVAGFIIGAAGMVLLYGNMLMDKVFVVELVLYLLGAGLFLRNQGHNR